MGWLKAAVIAGLLLSAVAWAGNEDLERCGQCHEHAWLTFRQDFHGAAALAGDHRMPTCLSCHGSKAIMPPLGRKNSDLADARAKSFKLCRPCHPALGSNAWLASGQVAYHQDLSLLSPFNYPNFPTFWSYFPGKAAWAVRAVLWLAAGFMSLLCGCYLVLLWVRLARAPEDLNPVPQPAASSSRAAAWVVLLTAGLVLTAAPALWPDSLLSGAILKMVGSGAWLRKIHQLLGLIFVLLMLGWLLRPGRRIELLAPLRRIGRMVIGLAAIRRLAEAGPSETALRAGLFRLEAEDALNLLLLPAGLVALAGGWLWAESWSLSFLPKWALDGLAVGHAFGGLVLAVWVAYNYLGLGILRPGLTRLLHSAPAAGVAAEKPDVAR
jgi:hypothetical protein